jgi:hypothetical protein
VRGTDEAALATILDLTPEQVALTVKAVYQHEVDLNFGIDERLEAQDRRHHPDLVVRSR